MISLVIFFPVLILVTKNQELKFGIILSFILYTATFVLVVFQFLFACDASVVLDKLVLKKKFRPKKSFAFNKIVKVSSFQLKSTKYIIVRMKNEDQSIEKFLILNTNALFSFENKDAESILRELQKSENQYLNKERY